MNKSLIFNIAFFVGIALIVGYLIWNNHFEKKHIEKDPVEIKIDSTKIQKNEIIKRFDCDTNFLFDLSDFTYKKNEILKRLHKPILIEVIFPDIIQKKDSIYILRGRFFSVSFLYSMLALEIEKTAIPSLCEYGTPLLAVVRDLELESIQQNEFISKHEYSGDEYKTILHGKCIYLERLKPNR